MAETRRFEIDPIDCVIDVRYIGGNKSKPIFTLRVYAENKTGEFEKTETDLFFYGGARDISAEILKELGWNGDFKNPAFGAIAQDADTNPYVLEHNPFEKRDGTKIDGWRIIRKESCANEKDLDELSAIFKSY